MKQQTTLTVSLALMLSLILANSTWITPRSEARVADTGARLHLPLVVEQTVGAHSLPANIADTSSWPTFTHPTWGIAFRYPPGWTADIPDFEKIWKDLEDAPKVDGYDSTITPEQKTYARTLGHIISLYPREGSGWGHAKIEMNLSTYTLSPDGALQNWVRLKYDWNENTGMPLDDELDLTALTPSQMPAGVEQAVYVEGEGDHLPRGDSLWWTYEGLVYGIHIYYSEANERDLAYQIFASLAFDPAQHANLREQGQFAGDEEALREFNESMRPVPVSPLVCPECRE